MRWVMADGDATYLQRDATGICTVVHVVPLPMVCMVHMYTWEWYQQLPSCHRQWVMAPSCIVHLYCDRSIDCFVSNSSLRNLRTLQFLLQISKQNKAIWGARSWEESRSFMAWNARSCTVSCATCGRRLAINTGLFSPNFPQHLAQLLQHLDVAIYGYHSFRWQVMSERNAAVMPISCSPDLPCRGSFAFHQWSTAIVFQDTPDCLRLWPCRLQRQKRPCVA